MGARGDIFPVSHRGEEKLRLGDEGSHRVGIGNHHHAVRPDYFVDIQAARGAFPPVARHRDLRHAPLREQLPRRQLRIHVEPCRQRIRCGDARCENNQKEVFHDFPLLSRHPGVILEDLSRSAFPRRRGMRGNRGHHDSHNHPPSAEAAPRLACLQIHAQHMDDKVGRGNGCCIRIQKQDSASIKNQRIFIDEEESEDIH